jgi:hypothetical protein
MELFWTGLAGGAGAFAHCLGMCGGFVLALSGPVGRKAALARQGLWLAGKTLTYVLLGALAGFSGVLLTQRLGRLEDVLAYLAGGVMILAGLGVLGLSPLRRRGQVESAGALSGLMGQVMRTNTPAGALLLGLLAGLLPCPIVLAFLAKGVQSGSVTGGMTLMAAMGLGTAGPLLVLGLTGQVLSQRLRRWGNVLAGVVLVLLGAVTVLRALPAFHQLAGCPHGQAASCCESQPAVAPASCPHCQSQPALQESSP